MRERAAESRTWASLPSGRAWALRSILRQGELFEEEIRETEQGEQKSARMDGQDGGTHTDGSSIKDFVENKDQFNAYVDKTFTSLDKEKKGTLTDNQLTPMMGTLGDALGLPPLGSSVESDHLYNEIFFEFSHGKNVTKQTFANVLRDVFLGLADGLERSPIDVFPLDGSTLHEYVEGPKFDADTVSIFTRLDAKSEGKIKGIMLVDGLKAISVAKGMPPADDPQMRPVVREGLIAAKVDVEGFYDEFQYSDALKIVVRSIADSMAKSPVSVAHSEKVYDGKSITSLLKDETTLKKVLDAAWAKLPKDKKERVSKDYLRVGVDEMSPAAGLPPVGAVDEMDDVLKTVFSKIDLDHMEKSTREDFDHTMVEVLGSLMLQLEGKPINITNSTVVEPEKV